MLKLWKTYNITVDGADGIATRAIFDRLRIKVYDAKIIGDVVVFTIGVRDSLMLKLTKELMSFIVMECKGYLRVERVL